MTDANAIISFQYRLKPKKKEKKIIFNKNQKDSKIILNITEI